MSATLLRSGENVTSFAIGKFNDTRLMRVGALLFKRMSEKLTVCIKSLGSNRATEVAFNRFLGNEKVCADHICEELSKKTNNACVEVPHVLCLQDTVQLTYPTQSLKKENFGPTGDSSTKGLFVHPGIIVDASNRNVLGMSSIITWCRDEKILGGSKKTRPIEEKESIRWVNTALSAKTNIKNANMITVVGDRESDIFEMFERVPDEKTQLIVRASHDRNLATGEKISDVLEDTEITGTHEIELPAITGKRKARDATLAIKYTSIWIIARLGGWNGYKSESPPGPIVMLRGLQKFEERYEGWLLAQ